MTKEITKSIILQELENKFGLREFDLAKFLFDETVIPTYDVGQHLGTWYQNRRTVAITGTGAALFYTVPMDEKWHVSRYDVVFMTGVYSIAGMYIDRVHELAADTTVYLDLKAAQTTSYHIEIATPVVLEPGDLIYANVDGYTSTGDLRIYIDFLREKIR